jgi:hypothetical protein
MNGFNLQGLCNALTNAYNLSCTTIGGSAYSSANVSATLTGNCLRCRLTATRSSATPAPLITNEKVCTVTINHGGKINGFLNVSFGNGGTGGVASFYTSEGTQTDSSISFSIYIASTAQSDTSFDTLFIMPVTININNFVD